MADLKYIAAEWLQENRGDGLCWYPPSNTVGLFDMRGTEQPLGFFCVSKLPSSGFDYTLLGKGDIRGSIEVSTSIRAFWRDFLSLTIEEMPDSITQLSEMLIKTFYYHGDPEGVKRFYPPTVTSKGNLEFFLSGHTRPGVILDKNMLHRRKFTGKDDEAWSVIQRHYKNIYQKYYDEDEPARFKVLSTWERELGVPAKDLQPYGINEKAVKPATTISDSFPDGNQTLEDTGRWTAVDRATGMRIVSNEVQYGLIDYVTFPATYRFDTAMSSANHLVEAVQVNSPAANSGNTSGFWSPVARFAAATESGVFVLAREIGLDFDLWEITAGTASLVSLGTVGSIAWPRTIKIQHDGSTLKGFENGVEKNSNTNTLHAGNLRGGLACHQINQMGTASCDDFEAADLAAGGIVPILDHYYRMMRNQ